MGLISLFQEIVGSADRKGDAVDAEIFELPSWYVYLKMLLGAGLGGLLMYFALVDSRYPGVFDRACMLVLGVLALGAAPSLTRRVRRVQIAHGQVTVDFTGGRREMWPARDLVADRPRAWGWPVAIRLRSTGRTAFAVPRDMPQWEVLLASLEVEAKP